MEPLQRCQGNLKQHRPLYIHIVPPSRAALQHNGDHLAATGVLNDVAAALELPVT